MALIDRLNDVATGGTYTFTGEKINLYNAILRALWSGLNINTLGSGLRSKQHGSAGISLFLDAVTGESSPVAVNPWDLLVDPGANSTSFNVQVYPGTVNGKISTNLLTTGALTTFNLSSISPTTLTYFSVSITVSSNQIASSTIQFSNTPSLPIPVTTNTLPTAFTYDFGVMVGGTPYRLIGIGHMYFLSWVQYRFPLASPPAGVIPWTDYMTWVLQIASTTTTI
jgi:hypothetical protein